MELLKIIQKISGTDIRGGFYTIFSYIPGMMLKKLKSEIWIVTEREDEARDNGFCFFDYVIKRENNQNIYYAINKKSNDYKKIQAISNNIIEFGGFKHCVYTWAANKYISSQYSNGMPNRILYYAWLLGWCKVKFCFLQHGVTQNRSLYLEQPASRVSFLSCVSERESDFMQKLGYSKKAVNITGFCRYDLLSKENIDKNQIFIMLTWRKYLKKHDKTQFVNTTYYKELYNLLLMISLDTRLSHYKFLICFHPGMRDFESLFRFDKTNIEVVDTSDYSFSKLINSSYLFITDYSSVAFDFAYLQKEVIYFQFDSTEFREKHFQEGYFDFQADGFGPVFKRSEEIINYLAKGERCEILKYTNRESDFFTFHDLNNCERTFLKIKEI